MKGVSMVPGIAILAVLTVTLGQTDVQATEEWHFDEYPNPLTAPGTCGRQNRTVSYICDPDSVITFEEANKIDVLIATVMHETECACSQSICDESPAKGYRIAVALAKKISDKAQVDQSNVSSSMGLHLHTAKVFALTLLQRWDIGRCHDDVLILYTVEDNIVYTTPGRVAASTLTEALMAEIQLKHRIYFSPGADVFVGLKLVIEDYKAVFQGDYHRLMQPTATPKYGAVVGGAANCRSPPLALLAALLLTVCAYQTH